MTWAPWPKGDKQGLARYVTAEATQWVPIAENRFDLDQTAEGRQVIIRAIYEAVAKKGIRYDLEKPVPQDDVVQHIRTPEEIFESPGAGTCLDLAILFCGLCLGYRLLPMLVKIKNHAIVAVSLSCRYDERDYYSREDRLDFKNGLLMTPERLADLVAKGSCVAIECTGFAQTSSFTTSMLEGAGRIDGLLPFQQACEAGKNYIAEAVRMHSSSTDDGDPFYALDVANLQMSGYTSLYAPLDNTSRTVRTGLQVRDVRQRWLEWEQRARERLFREDLGGHVDGIDSPLLQHWRKFLQARPWPKEIATRLKEIYQSAEQVPELLTFAQSLKDINCRANYDNIVAQVRQAATDAQRSTVATMVNKLKREENQGTQSLGGAHASLLNHAKKVLRGLYDLDRQLKDLRYQRCFLFVGGYGSGKTHFIASLLAANDDPITCFKSELVLHLKPEQDVPLHESIMRRIHEETLIPWSSLAEFSRFLEREKGTKLIIALDDIERWLSSRQRLDELSVLIADHTQYHALYWIIALQDTYFDKVAALSLFWRTYSYAGGVSRERAGSVLNTYDAPETPHPPALAGWLDLDELNRATRFGLSLLRKNLHSIGESDLVALDVLDDRADAARYLSSPFIVWILWDLRRSLPLLDVVNLNFVEFVAHFWQGLRANTYPEAPLSRQQLDECIYFIADHMALLNNFAPHYTLLLDHIVDASRHTAELPSELRSRDLAVLALDSLERHNLLRRRTSSLDVADIPQDRIEVRFEPFWEWRVARRLLPHSSIQDNKADEVWRNIEEWFRKGGEEAIREGVFEFLLLLLDQDQSRNKSQLIDQALKLGLTSTVLPTASTWFAGPKTTVSTQSKLAAYASKKTVTYGPRDLFAFMHFISESHPDVVTPAARVSFLQPHYQSIYEDTLTDYYLYIIRRLFSRTKDNAMVLDCMNYLSGCEAMDLAHELAKVSVKSLASNVNNKMTDLTDDILRYLKVAGQETEATERRCNSIAGPVKYLYPQWLLHEFCQVIVAIEGVDAYDILARKHWFTPERLRIAGPVNLWMRQEATWALGRWYRSNYAEAKRSSFVALVTRLAHSQGGPEKLHTTDASREDRERAFFLIRHTESVRKVERQERYGGTRVDERFQPLLRQLFLDPLMKKIVDNSRYLADFQANLKDLDELQRLRGKNRGGPVSHGGGGQSRRGFSAGKHGHQRNPRRPKATGTTITPVDR